MQPRPIIALILNQLVFVAFQWLAYQAYGWPGLVAAWGILVVLTWIEVRFVGFKIAQTAVQTAWFIFVLAAVHSGTVSFS